MRLQLEAPGEQGAPGGVWVSDRGGAGLAMIFAFQPSNQGGRPDTNGYQIGSFTEGQVADTENALGDNAEIAAQVVFANYLKFAKRMDLFAGVTGGRSIALPELQKLIKIG